MHFHPVNKKNKHINQGGKKPYPEPEIPVDFAWQEMKRLLDEGNVDSKPLTPPNNGFRIRYWKPGLFLLFLLVFFCYYLIKENGKPLPISKEKFKSTNGEKNNLKQKMAESPETPNRDAKNPSVIIDTNKVSSISTVPTINIDSESTSTSKNHSQFNFKKIGNKIDVANNRIVQNNELKKRSKKIDKVEQVSDINDKSDKEKKALYNKLMVKDSGNLISNEVKESLIDRRVTNDALNEKKSANDAKLTINKRRSDLINKGVTKKRFTKLLARKPELDKNVKNFNKQQTKISLTIEPKLNKNNTAGNHNLYLSKRKKEKNKKTEIHYSDLKNTFSNNEVQNANIKNDKDIQLMYKIKLDKAAHRQEQDLAITNKYNFSPYLLYSYKTNTDTNFLSTKKSEMVRFAEKVNILNEIKAKQNKPNNILNKVEIGLQLNLPLAQSKNYFIGNNGISQPYQLAIPGVYLSKQFKKNKISLQVVIAEQNYLGNSLVASETYTRSSIDTSIVSRNTYLLKTFGFGIGVQYVFALSPSFNLGFGIGYHNQKAGLVNRKETLINGEVLADSTNGFKSGVSNYPYLASSFIDTKIELSYVNKRFNIGFLLQKSISNLIDSSSYNIKPINAQFFIRYMIKRKR